MREKKRIEEEEGIDSKKSVEGNKVVGGDTSKVNV